MGRDLILRIEQLPKWLLCIPLVVQWFWLAARYRSLTLPSAINPSIDTGGLAGESKAACLALISPDFASHIAAWCRVRPGENADERRREHGLQFPLIAKPDVGWCGYGVRRIENNVDLAAYVSAFPRGSAFILQALIEARNEAGLFFVRWPGSQSGDLASVTFRHAPAVIGDGTSTIRSLIASDPRLRPHENFYSASRGAAALDDCPSQGAHVPLTTIASLRVGARYEDATRCITPALRDTIKAIAASMKDVHVARFDVRFEDLVALQAGRFQIIEVNGAGSEAIQSWDPALSMTQAFAGVFAKQRLLFALGHQMRAAGHKPCGPIALSKAWLSQQSQLKNYPPAT